MNFGMVLGFSVGPPATAGLAAKLAVIGVKAMLIRNSIPKIIVVFFPLRIVFYSPRFFGFL